MFTNGSQKLQSFSANIFFFHSKWFLWLFHMKPPFQDVEIPKVTRFWLEWWFAIWKVSNFAFEHRKQKLPKAITALACGQKRSLILRHCFSASVFTIAKSLCFVASVACNYGSRHSVTVIKQSQMEGECSEMSSKKCLLFSECRCIALVCGKQAMLLLCSGEWHCYILKPNDLGRYFPAIGVVFAHWPSRIVE